MNFVAWPATVVLFAPARFCAICALIIVADVVGAPTLPAGGVEGADVAAPTLPAGGVEGGTLEGTAGVEDVDVLPPPPPPPLVAWGGVAAAGWLLFHSYQTIRANSTAVSPINITLDVFIL